MNNKSSLFLPIKSEAVALLLYLITAILTAVHILILCVYYWADDEDKFDFVRMFDLQYEGKIPILYSSLLFFIAALLFWTLGRWGNSREKAGASQRSN